MLLQVIIACAAILLPTASCEVSNATRIALQQELTMNLQEKIAFDKFKNLVYKYIGEEHIIIRQDLYLLRFIRSKNLDVEVAKRDLLAMIKFVQENNLLNVINEKFPDLEVDYPFFIDSVDREGRPILYCTSTIGWNMRRAVRPGDSQRFRRYIFKGVFQMYLKVLEAGRKDPSVTQFVGIIDLGGFNLIQHSCPLCLSTYIYFLEMYEKWIPGYSRDIIFINAPPAVSVVLETLRPFVSKHTNKVLKIFGVNEVKWEHYLYKRIDPSQLPRFLGGSRPNP